MHLEEPYVEVEDFCIDPRIFGDDFDDLYRFEDELVIATVEVKVATKWRLCAARGSRARIIGVKLPIKTSAFACASGNLHQMCS